MFEAYTAVRAAGQPEAAWRQWRARRDDLFRNHAQSPLEDPERDDFAGLPFFPYNPAARRLVQTVAIDGESIALALGEDGTAWLQPFARTVGLAAPFGGELTLFWLGGYGGGVFLPFTDATSGRESFGGGRYLLDTIKGADLGSDAEHRVMLDFNFAYNPSCSYSHRYICPLAPPGNRLPGAVRAGEQVMAPPTARRAGNPAPPAG